MVAIKLNLALLSLAVFVAAAPLAVEKRQTTHGSAGVSFPGGSVAGSENTTPDSASLTGVAAVPGGSGSVHGQVGPSGEEGSAAVGTPFGAIGGTESISSTGQLTGDVQVVTPEGTYTFPLNKRQTSHGTAGINFPGGSVAGSENTTPDSASLTGVAAVPVGDGSVHGQVGPSGAEGSAAVGSPFGAAGGDISVSPDGQVSGEIQVITPGNTVTIPL